MLHIRLGQSEHVYDIFLSLFDIVEDTELLGIKQSDLSQHSNDTEENKSFSGRDEKPGLDFDWKTPNLFEHTLENIMEHFQTSQFDRLKTYQMLFYLVHASFLINSSESSKLVEILKFWYRFIRQMTKTVA